MTVAGPLGTVDHRRIVEDLTSLSEHFRRGEAAAPLALIAQVGGDLLYARRNDLGAWRLKRDDEFHRLLASLPYRRAFRDALRVSWLHLALVLGRKDLHERFLGPARFDLEAAIKWLVLYGVNEHGLWRFLDRRFLQDLRRRVIATPHGAVSPLDLILLDERPDLRGAAPFGGASFAAEMDGWIERNGVHEYKLFWLMDEAAFARMAAAAPPELRAPSATFASALSAAHASGRIDIFVGDPKAASALDALSRRTPQEREASLKPPIDEFAAAEEDEEPTRQAPTPLRGDLVSTFDFLPGDAGFDVTMAGVLGRPTSEGAPFATPSVTFHFQPPRARRIVLVIDAGLSDPEASLLVRINGRAADLIPAAALTRGAAKVHAVLEALEANGGLSLEIECIAGDFNMAGSNSVVLRSLAVVCVT